MNTKTENVKNLQSEYKNWKFYKTDRSNTKTENLKNLQIEYKNWKFKKLIDRIQKLKT